jgi:peptidoglycan/xylan/chitin deacetylase (PgdA/CDA1 family)
MRRVIISAIALVVMIAAVATVSAASAHTPVVTVSTDSAQAPVPTKVSSRCGIPNGYVLLTYDDAWYADLPRTVDINKWYAARGIMIGNFITRQPYKAYQDRTGVNLIQRVRNTGQPVMNHTWSHVDLAKATSSQVTFQMNGGPGRVWMRPPGGSLDAQALAVLSALGYKVACLWTYDTKDYTGKTAWQICQGVVNGVGMSGGVVLQHYFTNAPAAKKCIVNGLREKGLKFCKVPYPGGSPLTLPAALPCRK